MPPNTYFVTAAVGDTFINHEGCVDPYLSKHTLQEPLPFFFAIMVLILDGNSEHVAHARRKIGVLEKKKNLLVIALNLIKCLKQIK